MSTTGLTLLTNAFASLNAYMPGDTISTADQTTGLTLLNNLIGNLGLQTAPLVSRQIFPLVAGQGGPADPGNPGSGPYTIGPGGNFNTVRPASQATITGVGLNLNASRPSVEIARSYLTDDMYEAIHIKDLSTALFTSLYYNPTAVNGLGTIYLWPVPNTALNSLVLYSKQPLGAFSTLAASYDLPTGWDKALSEQLALELETPYGRSLPDRFAQRAAQSLRVMKRAAFPMSDLAIDPIFTADSRTDHGYNILTGR